MSSSSTRAPTPEGAGSASQVERAITRRRFAGVIGLAGASLAAELAPDGTHAYAAGGRGLMGRRRQRYRRPRPPRRV